jgi:hypothetical protein
LVWKAAAAGTEETSAYVPISGAALKKAVKKVAELEKKAKKQAEQASEQAAKDQAAAEERERVLEAAKAIVLTENPALPAAQKIKIRNGVENRGKRVKVSGWVHRLRVQGKNMTFIILRDGTGYLQCVLTDTLVSLLFAPLDYMAFRTMVILTKSRMSRNASLTGFHVISTELENSAKLLMLLLSLSSPPSPFMVLSTSFPRARLYVEKSTKQPWFFLSAGHVMYMKVLFTYAK